MSRSPILSAIVFWGSFLFFHKYSSRHPVTGAQNYPSYAIFKEKIVKDTWHDGFDGQKISTDWGHFTIALQQDIEKAFKE